MTRQTNARLAGFMFLFYIACAFPVVILVNQATAGAGVAANFSSIASHTTFLRVTAVLALVTIFDAIVLAVALHAITRDVDPHLALLALCCRVGEGVLNAVGVVAILGLLWAATTTTPATPDAAARQVVGALLLNVQVWGYLLSAMLFAVGSTLFAYLLLRARSIPVALSWLGVAGSALLVPALPLQLAGVLGKPVTDLMWIPVGVFEVVVAFWLLIRGVAERTPASSGSSDTGARLSVRR